MPRKRETSGKRMGLKRCQSATGKNFRSSGFAPGSGWLGRRGPIVLAVLVQGRVVDARRRPINLKKRENPCRKRECCRGVKRGQGATGNDFSRRRVHTGLGWTDCRQNLPISSENGATTPTDHPKKTENCCHWREC